MNLSTTHTYRAHSEVNFFLNEQQALTVTIDTSRLHLRSVERSERDYQFYGSLFGDATVMNRFATGETSSREEMEARINNVWVKRWQKNDPYSALAVEEKDSDQLIGHVVAGHTGVAGQSELAYLFKADRWGRGFATEAVTAVVHEFAPATVNEGYFLDGKPLENVVATARLDNLASVKILKKLGMKQTGEEQKYGALRHHFSLELSQLPFASSSKSDMF